VSALSDHLSRLFEFLARTGISPPTNEVRIIEIEPKRIRDDSGRLRVTRDELRRADDYASRFDELMRAGLAWINMTVYGVYDGWLIVGIEVPDPRGRKTPATRMSVNYSGPPEAVKRHQWDAKKTLAIDTDDEGSP
jgi:hypothetical protein